MARVKVDLPKKFIFSHTLTVRVGDLNYGNHLANDAILALVHEARVRFLHHFNQSEKDFFGSGLIMADTAIQYKNEAFLFDEIKVEIGIGDTTKAGFDLVYQLSKTNGKLVALVKTGMVCFDYQARKICLLPEAFKDNFL